VDLASERECLACERDRFGRVTDEHAVGYGDGELDGGVREVAAGPRETGCLFGQAAGVFERAGRVRDVRPGGAEGLLDPPVRGIPARAGVGRPAAQLLGAGHVRAK
jgi:hypothetical protein